MSSEMTFERLFKGRQNYLCRKLDVNDLLLNTLVDYDIITTYHKASIKVSAVTVLS